MGADSTRGESTRMSWGFCMVGNEEAFCKYLKLAFESTELWPFRYLEIGLGDLKTFMAVHDFLDNTYAHQCAIEMDGVDLPTWTRVPEPPRSRIVLMGSASYFASSPDPADFIFIDGCHAHTCCVQDFLGAERIIRPGGIVCFHDVNPHIQGQEKQPHCGQPVNVRPAIEVLGLLNGTRSGWKFLEETTGDEQKGGRGCMFFQRE